jgi:hypothetical protein
MTATRGVRYCPSLMKEWQSDAAFVIQFRHSPDIEAGRVEGRIEHIASYKAARFHSVNELFGFINRVLADIRDSRER